MTDCTRPTDFMPSTLYFQTCLLPLKPISQSNTNLAISDTATLVSNPIPSKFLTHGALLLLNGLNGLFFLPSNTGLTAEIELHSGHVTRMTFFWHSLGKYPNI
jgi:hypothetical protein